MKFRNLGRGVSVIALCAVVAVVFACSPAPTPVPPTAVPTNPPPTQVPATTAPVAPTAATGGSAGKAVTLQLAKNDTLGTFLADGDGNTLYMFTKDVKGTSNCYDNCAKSWPPLVPAGQPTLKDGIVQGLVGTTQRTDGSAQLTYNGWPLYYYAKDQKPGDTVGQAVGKVWWVVSGEGNIIRPAAVNVAQNDKLGKVLADGQGFTLYMFTKDTKDTSNCYDKCEVAWPPLLQVGAPTAGAGVDASKFGSAVRKDGSTQVTYNGMPLYYYDKDKAAGDVTGQGVGKVWYVVAPDGTTVQTAP